MAASYQQLPITEENWTPPEWSTMSLEELKERVRWWRHTCKSHPQVRNLTDVQCDKIAELSQTKPGGFWYIMPEVIGEELIDPNSL